MQRRERILVDLDTQTGPGGNGHRAVDEVQRSRHDVLVLPRRVRIAGIGMVRCCRGEVNHRGQADAEVAVRVHRQSELENVTDSGEQP
ncbi:hypothetical protein ASG84_24985 [Rhodococcus sp. Leaf278]|nr:hypothetical protein ASG84_24985 [Rhodococcus sp. Leaf278]